MIKNFDSVKDQLRELASIINTFKSEAVQLRLIELVFQAVESDSGSSDPGEAGSPSAPGSSRRPAPSKPRRKSATAEGAEANGKQKSSGRMGGKSALNRLLAEGFFKQPKTINHIVEHCVHNLATKLKQSDLSGPLARMTRDGALKRVKNSDKQYEYSQE